MRAARALGRIAVAASLVFGAARTGKAQFVDAALPHRGEFRTGFVLSQSIYDRVFVPDGAKELLGAPLSRPLDARFFPELADADTAVANLLAAVGGSPPAGPLTLGRARVDLQAEISELRLELLFGVTSWLSVGGELPVVRAQVSARTGLEEEGAGSTSTAFGGNPTGFFADVDTAIAALDALIASRTLDPTQQAQAQDLRARTQTYADGLESLNDRFTLLPTDSGEAGQALGVVHDEIVTGFESFGLGFPDLDLADPFPADTALALLADSLALAPFTDVGRSYRLGDAALKLFVQPWNTFRSASQEGDAAWLRGRAVVGLVRRFDTGHPDRLDRPYDLPTGRGSASTEIRATLDLAVRRKLWLTLDAEAVFQESHALDRRVTPPDTPLVDESRTAAVTRSPGAIWRWTLVPRYNVNETLSLGLVVQAESRARDEYAYAGAPLAGIAADVLGEGSDATATRWGLELRYRTTGYFGETRLRSALEGVFSYRRTTSGDGRVPASSEWRVGARLHP